MSKSLKLKNYTTSVSADRTIVEIERLLANFGASAIMKEYATDATCISLSFKLNEKGIKLPANVEGVYEVMYGEKKKAYGTNKMQGRDTQAYNTSWRIIKDWLHAQLSLIASGQATPEQVLLPYIFDGKRTLYEAYKNGAIQLSSGNSDMNQRRLNHE